jgi:hypothetical protein
MAPIGAEGVKNDPESVFFMLHGRIDITGNCIFPIIFEPIQRLALSRQPISGRSTKNTRAGIVRLL